MVEETMMVTDWDDLVLDDVDLDSLFDQIPNNNENDGLDELEHFLLNDDLLNDDVNNVVIDENQFFNDIFLAADSPPTIPIEEDAPKSLSSSDLRQQKEDNEEEEDNSHDDDPLTKKRKRQLRNKDAALRFRERNKSYLKELEMKSRYYEAECRRLGSDLEFPAAVGFPAMFDGLGLSAARPSKSTGGGNRGRRKNSSKSGTKEGAK